MELRLGANAAFASADRQVLELGVEALDGDVEVPVEGAPDRIVDRQVEHPVRLRRRTPFDEASKIEGRSLCNSASTMPIPRSRS